MGSITPAPRPQGRAGSSAFFRLGWWVAVGAIGLSVWLWNERGDRVREPAGDASATLTQATAPGRDSSEQSGDSASASAILDRDRRLAVLEIELVQARQELDAAQRQLEESRDDAERYRLGLEESVAELNRLEGELGQLRSSSAAGAARSLPPAGEDKVHPLGAPLVTISPMGFVVASGQVYNPTRYAARGKLQISLVGSAGVIETRDFLMRVGPGASERYDITFPNIFPTERIAAQVSWVE